LAQGIDPFRNDLLYLSWGSSPLRHLMIGYCGPLLMRSIPLNSNALWLFLAFMAGAVLLVVCRRVPRRDRPSQSTVHGVAGKL
jgi:hypothetical protein